MANEAKTVNALPVANSLSTTDVILCMRSPTANTAQTVQLTLGKLFSNCANIVCRTVTAPANSTAMNVASGTFVHDGSFLYLATANNVLKKVAALTSF